MALLADPGMASPALRALLEVTADGLVLLDPAGRVTGASRSLLDLLDVDPDALLGVDAEALPEHLARGMEAPERAAAEIARVLGGSEPLETALLLRTSPSGAGLRARAAELAWDEGAPGRALFIVEAPDLSARLEATERDLAEAQAKLLHSEKMAALGMLMAGIAHEINTPVGAIGSMQDTLVRAVDKLGRALDTDLPGGREAHPKVESLLSAIDDANRVIADGARRVTEIVRRLRSFARIDETRLEAADLNEGIEDTLTLIRHELKRGVTVHRRYGALPRVACYPGRLNQVFLNLLMNAKQAMPEGGEITITTWQDGGWVYVRVDDTGTGIAPEHLEQIFEPGFTTKTVGLGTGLGLSICRQIARAHQGELEVDSELGRGSAFTLRVPTDLEERLERASESDEAELSE